MRRALSDDYVFPKDSQEGPLAQIFWISPIVENNILFRLMIFFLSFVSFSVFPRSLTKLTSNLAVRGTYHILTGESRGIILSHYKRLTEPQNIVGALRHPQCRLYLLTSFAPSQYAVASSKLYKTTSSSYFYSDLVIAGVHFTFSCHLSSRSFYIMVCQEPYHPSVLSRLERKPHRFIRIADPQATQTLHSAPYVEDAMVISNMVVHCSSLCAHVPLSADTSPN
jgi:hypothetical protein